MRITSEFETQIKLGQKSLASINTEAVLAKINKLIVGSGHAILDKRVAWS